MSKVFLLTKFDIGSEKKMTENEPEIYVPLESTNLRQAIPSGDKILYSTMCSAQIMGQLSFTGTKYTQSVSHFQSHVILTTGGVAFTIPGEKDVDLQYFPWHEVTNLYYHPNFPDKKGFELKRINFFLERSGSTETEEKFRERLKGFIDRFRPIILKEKQKWLDANMNNPAIDKTIIKVARVVVDRLNKDEERKLRLDEKKKKKELKKKKG